MQFSRGAVVGDPKPLVIKIDRSKATVVKAIVTGASAAFRQSAPRAG